ncbi:MAG: hypothetical protein ABIC82_00055 [bacterium]
MLTTEDIKKRMAEEKIFQSINGFAKSVLLSYNFKLAYGLIRDLEEIFKEQPDFSKKHPRRYAQYQDIIVKAKFIALMQIREQEVINLFNNHFKEAFELEYYDLQETLRGVLAAMPVFKHRDEVKQKIKQALLNNSQVITSQKLKMKIGEEEKEIAPTVGNWLRDYNKKAGGGRVSKVAQARYITNNRNIKVLDEDERKIVVTLIEFYEFLKKSSLTDEGAEEKVMVVVDGKLKLFNQGRLEELESPKVKELMKKIHAMSKETANASPADSVKITTTSPSLPAKLSSSPVNLKATSKTTKQLMQEALIGDNEKEIKKLESEIKNSEGDDVEKIIGGLMKSPQPPFAKGGTVEEVVARLRLLAKKDPKSLAKLLESGGNLLTPSNFQKLIKNILGGKFGMSDDETARYGMQLAIILKKQNMSEFMKTVYFDKRAQVFRWNTD